MKRVLIILIFICLVTLFIILNLEGINGKIILCNNCDDCSSNIQLALAGDTVFLTADISNRNGHCIRFSGKDNIIFDCGGHLVDGDGDTDGTGIYLRDGANNNIIQNCVISDFREGIGVEIYSMNNVIRNIIASNGYYGIILVISNNTIIINVTTSNYINGIAIYQSSNHNIVSDIKTSDNTGYGISISSNSNNNLIKSVDTSNSESGICISNSNNNILKGIHSYNNEHGIELEWDADNNNITYSYIEANTIGGIFLDPYYDEQHPEYNFIYNNYFNQSGTVNIDGTIPNPNYFNSNLYYSFKIQNIIGGQWFGGNYWTNPSKTGWSDSCSDTNKDGICDVPYELYTGSMDYYPLTQLSTPQTCTGTCMSNQCSTYTDCTSLTGECATGYCCSGTCFTSNCCPADNNPTDGVVSIAELINYISQWKSGSVTISELIIGIGEWKNGCS